jgi:hypothetical protein
MVNLFLFSYGDNTVQVEIGAAPVSTQLAQTGQLANPQLLSVDYDVRHRGCLCTGLKCLRRERTAWIRARQKECWVVS